MRVQEALIRLKNEGVTTSVQMLRRWLRQGKIKATMDSKRIGYDIDGASLEQFIFLKKAGGTENDSPWKSLTYEEGLRDGLRIEALAVRDAISEREKELILKGLKESDFRYTVEALLRGFSDSNKLKKHLQSLKITELTVNVLGGWVYDPTFRILIAIEALPYPNRKLSYRVKHTYREQLLQHFESNL